MSAWLGIGILLAFSLGLSLFMRLEREPKPEPSPELRIWTRVESSDLPPGIYLERRVVTLEARGLRGSRWVEQRRTRRVSDDAIVAILDERPFRPS